MLNEFLSGSAAWGVLLTLAAFALGALINRITGKAIFNPLLLGSIFVIIFLSVCKIPYADYKASAAPVNYLLLPATVALAIPLYEKWDLLRENAAAIGLDLTHSAVIPGGRTGTYLFIADSDGDMAVAVADMEICEKLTPAYIASQKELLDGAAAVVVDANLPRESIAYLVEHCAAPLFVDPVSTVKAEKLQGLLSHVHTLKPNRIEAELLSGVKISDDATLHQAAQALLDQGVQRVFLSLGGDGVFAAQQGETHLEPICKAEMRNATGAGDAMMASLVWSFLAGRDLAESCAAGTAAAAIAVESEETINPNMSAEAVLARAAK